MWSNKGEPRGASIGWLSTAVSARWLPTMVKLHVPVKPKNDLQAGYLDALRVPNVRTVICFGQTGSGKTYCAVAAGLQWLSKVCGNHKFSPPHSLPVLTRDRIWQDVHNGRRKLVLVNPTQVQEHQERRPDYLWRANRPAIECIIKLAFDKDGLSRQCMDANEPCAPSVLRQICAAPRSTNRCVATTRLQTTSPQVPSSSRRCGS